MKKHDDSEKKAEPTAEVSDVQAVVVELERVKEVLHEVYKTSDLSLLKKIKG